MKNVIDALRVMAENGGRWGGDTCAGVWYLGLSAARSYSYACVGFTQSDVEDFLKYYDTLTTQIDHLEMYIETLHEHYKNPAPRHEQSEPVEEVPGTDGSAIHIFGDETDAELLDALRQLDGKPPYIQMAFKEMREFNVEDTYTSQL